MKNVLGMDTGYGDNKVVLGDAKGNISKIYKFNSVLAHVGLNPNIVDSRVKEYKGSHYYIGDLALRVESTRIIDLLNYANLEKFAPLLIKHLIDDLLKGEVPEVLVCGLSIAHIENSGHFKKAIQEYLVDECKMPIEKINIIPQGIGGKITYDKYGSNFPDKNSEFNEIQNYIGCDIGFNTLDVFQVIDGKTSPNLIRGIENQGIVKIVSRLLQVLQDKYARTMSIKEGKEVLDKGSLRVRGNEYSMSNDIAQIKTQYYEEMKQIIEDNFGSILDKVDKIRMFGGGSYIFKNMNDPFIEIPETRAEYYNAIGQYLYGIGLLEKS